MTEEGIVGSHLRAASPFVSNILVNNRCHERIRGPMSTQKELVCEESVAVTGPDLDKSSRTRLTSVLAGCGGYVVGAILSVALLFPIVRLQQADLRAPFAYEGDCLFYFGLLKNLHHDAWYYQTSLLGYPYEQDYRAFPQSDGWLHFAIFKTFGLLGADLFLATNLFFLVGFPLTTMTSFWALRRFGVNDAVALALSLLYAFAPYHIARMPHLFLAAYYLWPPMAWLILQVYRGKFSWRGGVTSKVSVALFLIATGIGGIYYAIFASFFLLVATVAAAGRDGAHRLLAHGAGAIALIALGAGATVLPSALYLKGQPANPDATRRFAVEAENHGLKLAQLLLPTSNHPIASLRKTRERYNNSGAPAMTENGISSMGAIASLGLLVVLSRVVLRWRDSDDTLWDGLTCLSVATILLSTVGGFGSLVAHFGFAWLRCYNRISICLQFFALTAVGLLLSQAYFRLARKGTRGEIIAASAVFAITALGLWDQTPHMPPYNYAAAKASFVNDREFFQSLEAKLGPDSTLFPLPSLPFPEHLEGQYCTYELLRPYLHTSSMRLSFGALRGYEGDEWAKHFARLPIPSLVDSLARAEFSGIYLDRRAFGDHGTQAEQQLVELIPTHPINSRDGQLAFFDLRPLTARLKGASSPHAWETQRQRTLYPILVLFRGEFSGPMGDHRVRDFAKGELHLVNSLSVPRTVRLRFSVRQPGKCAERQFSLSGPILAEQHTLDDKGISIDRVIEVPPGRNVVRLDIERKTGLLRPILRDLSCEELPE